MPPGAPRVPLFPCALLTCEPVGDAPECAAPWPPASATAGRDTRSAGQASSTSRSASARSTLTSRLTPGSVIVTP